VLGEYDGNNNLLRKYIYGPGIDQPVCIIEVADANAVYYYHFDALGSVVALSDAAGDTVQTYEYSVYGEVAVEDANHPNPYMFAGVRYDIEIGLYYNRARYYNPFTGRFLQTDPIGYKDGMNAYEYCGNNPVVLTDPTGMWAAYDYAWIKAKNDANETTWVLMLTFWEDEEKTDLKNVMFFLNWDEVWYYIRGCRTRDVNAVFGDPDFDTNDFTDWYKETGHPDPPKGGLGPWGWVGGGIAATGALLNQTKWAGGGPTAMIIGGMAVVIGDALDIVDYTVGMADDAAEDNKYAQNQAANGQAPARCPICHTYKCKANHNRFW
jgi:RHS repeat-associated protein